MVAARSRLAKCLNIDDVRRVARGKLPRPVFDYIDGYAEDGVSGRANETAFDRYRLVPRVLQDTGVVDTRTQVLGQEVAMPILLAPTALSRLFHPDGERAVAAAAARADVLYALSTLSSVPLEEIAGIAGPRWFQLYVYKDRPIVADLIERARDHGYQALCLTVDANTGGNRERDIRNGLVIPPRLSARTLLHFCRQPLWSMRMLAGPPVQPGNVQLPQEAGARQSMSLLQYAASQLKENMSWQDAQWMRDRWDGPFIIKGILSVADARKAADIGASAIVLSNHGGRQLDHAPAALEVLPEVLDAVGSRCEVYIDGGIRRATDVLKALALGAGACLIGRPYLYGLAAGGMDGVQRVLEIFNSELQRDLRLLGCKSVREINSEFIRAA